VPQVKDYYRLLGIGPDASADDIRAAFLEKAQAAHPDRVGSREQMQELCEAVEILADPDRRQLYDRLRAEPLNATLNAEWEPVAAAATARAGSFQPGKGDLRQWLSEAATDVQKTAGGRTLAGLAGGFVFGVVLGAALGYFMHLNIGVCVLIGAITGAAAGALGAASNN